MKTLIFTYQTFLCPAKIRKKKDITSNFSFPSLKWFNDNVNVFILHASFIPFHVCFIDVISHALFTMKKPLHGRLKFGSTF